MNLPYYQIDAFGSGVFTGNPAGVCLLADWLPDPVLQAIASENNLSETAFVVGREGDFDLRWFTPCLEVDLCGHATLAAAHVIYEHLGWGRSMVRFRTRSGVLAVTREAGLLTMDFPARPAVPCAVPEALEEGLGQVPLFLGKARDYLAVFDSEATVRELRPLPAKLLELDCLGVIVTAPGERSDFVSRFFAPGAGVAEDPVTGSAHCTLTPYWAQRLGRNKLHARQVSGRGGELHCEWRQAEGRVNIAGRAFTYATGFLHVARAETGGGA